MLYHHQKKPENINDVIIREWVHRIGIVLFGAILIYFTWF